MSVKLSKYKTKKKHNRDKKTKKKQHIHILNGGMKTLKQPKKIYKAPVVQHSRTHFSPGDEQETNPQAQQSPSQKKNKTRSYLGHVRKAFRKFIPPKLPNSKYVKQKSNKQNSIKAKTDKKADKVNNNTTPLSNEDAQALLKKTLGGQNNDKNEGYEEGPEKPGKRNNKTANNGNGYGYDHKKTEPPPQTSIKTPNKLPSSITNTQTITEILNKPPPSTTGTQTTTEDTNKKLPEQKSVSNTTHFEAINPKTVRMGTFAKQLSSDEKSTTLVPVNTRNIEETAVNKNELFKSEVIPINSFSVVNKQSESEPELSTKKLTLPVSTLQETNENPYFNVSLKSQNINNKLSYLDPSSIQDTYLDVNPKYLNVSKSNQLYHVANPQPKTEYFDPTTYFNTSSAISGKQLTINSKKKTKNIKSVNGKSNSGYFTVKGPGNVDYAKASTIQVGFRKKTTKKNKNKSTAHLPIANPNYLIPTNLGNTAYAELSQTPNVGVSIPNYNSNTGNPYNKLNKKSSNKGYRVAEAPKNNVEYAEASTNPVDSKEQTSLTLTPKPEILPNSGVNTTYPKGKQKTVAKVNTDPGVALRTTAAKEPSIISTTNNLITTFEEARQAIQAKIASQNIKPKPLLSKLPKRLLASKVYLNTSTKGSISTTPAPSDDIDVIHN